MSYLDKLYAEALKRLRIQNEFAAKKEHEKISQLFHPELSHHEPFQRITLTIYNREQFYACVKWCNKNCGQGKKYWTTVGRILRYIDPSKKAYNPPRITDWIIKVPVDITELVALTM